MKDEKFFRLSAKKRIFAFIITCQSAYREGGGAKRQNIIKFKKTGKKRKNVKRNKRTKKMK